MFKRAVLWVLLPAAAAVLVACGGGGGGPSSSSSSFGGTAAVGAPLRGVVVEVFDIAGQLVVQTRTDDAGKYQVQIPAGKQGPFVIKAIYADEALFSVYSGQGGVANISHLTDAVTAMLSPSGASDGLLSGEQNSTLLTDEKISEAVEKLNAAILPARTAISDIPASANFMSTAFVADGTGIDRLLDTASVTVTAKTVDNQNSANIGVTFNIGQGLNNLKATQLVTFDSKQPAGTILARSASLSISDSQLPPENIGKMYNELLDRLNSCYAIPLEERVDNNKITNKNCRDIFYNSNPDIFKDGGFSARQRFNSMFEARNIRFSPTISPIIAHDLIGVNSSGKALVASKGEDSLGNFAYNRFYVQKFELDGREVLGAIGDQNDHEFYINSESDHRTFALSEIDLDFVQSQFALIVRLQSSGGVNPEATAAVVEGPGGRFLLAPQAGRGSFRLCGQLNDTQATPDAISTRPSACNTNKPPLLVYASRFVNQQSPRPYSGKTIESPLDFDHIKNDFFIVKKDDLLLSDSEIEMIPRGATWKATLYFSDGSKKELFTHNTSRPMTAQELMGSDSPIYRSANFTNMVVSEGLNKDERSVDFTTQKPFKPNETIPDWSKREDDIYDRGKDKYTPVWAPINGGYQFKWSVAQKQIAPFVIFMSGQVKLDWKGKDLGSNVFSFDDITRFSVARRDATVFCTPTLADPPTDQSCDFDLDMKTYYKDLNDQYFYNPGSWMVSTALISRDQQQRSIIRGYNWFIPRVNGVRVE